MPKLKKIRPLTKKINLNSADTNKIRILGLYQILGGLFGVGLMFIQLRNLLLFSVSQNLILIFGLLLFLYSCYCGFLLITKEYIKGLKLSVLNQAIQILGIGILGFHFTFISGLFAGFSIDLTDDFIIGANLDLSSIFVAFDFDYDSIYITVNVLAIVILGIIFRIKEKIEKEYKLRNS